MARKGGTVRGRIFRTPLAARHRLKYIREFLNWLYASGLSDKELRVGFWSWFIGVSNEQARREVWTGWDAILRKTRGWPWPIMQEDMRKKIEEFFGGLDKTKGLTLKFPRSLGKWRGPRDGRIYFHYGPVLPVPLRAEHVEVLGLDQFLSNLDNLSLEALSVCQQCGRFFVTLRPTRSRYCSGSCRGRAYLLAHGFKPPKKRKQKEGASEHAQRA